MNEQQPAQGGQESAAVSVARPAPSPSPPRQPLPPDRKAQAFFGGLLAGIGIAIGLAIVMHVIQMASPIGYGINLDGSIALVLLLAGPIIGLGLGFGLAAAAPGFPAVPAAPPPATPMDQPPAPQPDWSSGGTGASSGPGSHLRSAAGCHC